MMIFVRCVFMYLWYFELIKQVEVVKLLVVG